MKKFKFYTITKISTNITLCWKEIRKKNNIPPFDSRKERLAVCGEIVYLPKLHRFKMVRLKNAITIKFIMHSVPLFERLALSKECEKYIYLQLQEHGPII
jgi:hypothetical protein